MKLFFLIFLFIFNFEIANSSSNVLFFLESAYKNNPKLNAERENLKSSQQNINISRSEFLPNISISGSVEGTTSSNRTNKSGANISDSSVNTETKKISVDQKIFQGFKGYN